MYKTVLTLLACLALAQTGEAATALALDAGTVAIEAAVLPLPVPYAAGSETAAAEAKPESQPEAKSSSVVREIVAGVLTGSLAAVLMLKILYGRRRRD